MVIVVYFMEVIFLINPRSGRGKGLKWLNHIKDFCFHQGWKVFFWVSESAEHLKTLAVRAKEHSAQWIVVVGGDGTFHQVAKVLLGTSKGLSILPCGSGNGIAQHFAIPSHPIKALQRLTTLRKRLIDVAFVNDVPFFGFMGCGFDAWIAHQFAYQNTRGLYGYLKQILKHYFRFEPPTFTLQMQKCHLELQPFLFVVMNVCLLGNGFYLAPDACAEDGLLEGVALQKPPWWKTLPTLWYCFTKQTYKSAYVQHWRAKRFVLQFPHDRVAVHLDGEPYWMKAPLKVVCQPKQLTLWLG